MRTRTVPGCTSNFLNHDFHPPSKQFLCEFDTTVFQNGRSGPSGVQGHQPGLFQIPFLRLSIVLGYFLPRYLSGRTYAPKRQVESEFLNAALQLYSISVFLNRIYFTGYRSLLRLDPVGSVRQGIGKDQ